MNLESSKVEGARLGCNQNRATRSPNHRGAPALNLSPRNCQQTLPKPHGALFYPKTAGMSACAYTLIMTHATPPLYTLKPC